MSARWNAALSACRECFRAFFLILQQGAAAVTYQMSISTRQRTRAENGDDNLRFGLPASGASPGATWAAVRDGLAGAFAESGRRFDW